MKWIVFGLLMSLSLSAVARPLTPAARLKKLSRMVRGIDPEMQEYKDLAAAVKANQAEAFFDTAATAYLATTNHQGKMVSRLEELFHLQTNASPTEARSATYTSTENLFNRIAQKNESWDQLILSKNYVIYDTAVRKETDFFRLLFDEVNPGELKGEADDARLAGAVTTLRFANRYTNSSTNKNRRRAAAVFRIFLCDPMRPAVDVDQGELAGIFDLAFGKEQVAAEQHKTAVGADQHGTDPKCMTCHYKLDPMGRFFSAMGSALGPNAAKGRLVFKRKDGSKVDIEGNGLGEMAKALVAQPEYAECQVSHFWKWFITSANPLTRDVQLELAKKFDELGRKPNDFIKYLVTRKEFTEAPDQNKETVMFMSKVQPVFKRCNECHKDMTGFPDFTQVPMGGNKEQNVIWLSKISNILDLQSDGTKRMMPPSNAGWDLNKSEIADIKRWIEDQAKDDKGEPTLTPEQVGQVMRGGK